MYQLQGYRDVEDLKWKIANDPNIIRVLANFAHTLGYAWCFGTRSKTVGGDFDVRKDGDNYVLQAHYDGNEPHPDDHWPDRRLCITLSNFQIRFDPGTFVYGTPVIKNLQPVAISTYVARNGGDTDDTVTKTFTFQLSETVTHTTNFSFTEGIKVAAKAGAKIPFFGEGELSTEFSFSATQGWSDSSATTEGQQDTCTYTAKLPPHSQRLIRLVATRVSSDVAYTALAQVGFDIQFDGFLRSRGNAKADHTGSWPTPSLHFGNGTQTGFEEIWDKWKHREIPGYWKDWDWAWMQQHFGGILEWTMRFIGDGVGASISGKFNNVKGTSVHVDATTDDHPQQNTGAIATMELAEAREGAQAPTAAAMHEMARADAGPSAQIAGVSLLHEAEIPGARVIKIEHGR